MHSVVRQSDELVDKSLYRRGIKLSPLDLLINLPILRNEKTRHHVPLEVIQDAVLIKVLIHNISAQKSKLLPIKPRANFRFTRNVGGRQNQNVGQSTGQLAHFSNKVVEFFLLKIKGLGTGSGRVFASSPVFALSIDSTFWKPLPLSSPPPPAPPLSEPSLLLAPGFLFCSMHFLFLVIFPPCNTVKLYKSLFARHFWEPQT